MVNELQEGSGRSVKHSQVDTHTDPLCDESRLVAAGRVQGGFNLSRVTTRDSSSNYVLRLFDMFITCGLTVGNEESYGTNSST